MRTTLAVVILLLLSATGSQAMDPPVIEWERLYFPGYYSSFKYITETSDGGYAATVSSSVTPAFAFYRLSADGNILWGARSDIYNQSGQAVVELSDGNFVTTGFGKETSSSSTGLLLAKYSSTGQEIWMKIYNILDSSENGYSLCVLPDGGFAICGTINPVEGMDQAWILRTDSQGDTLWTREWGWQYNDKAMSILYIDNGLTVLMHGNTPTTPGGPHLVRYDMDGNMLWETDIPVMAGEYAQDMCEASDGGLLILTNNSPTIVHTDYYGNVDWVHSPYPLGNRFTAAYGWSIDTTMDGGIIYGGENRWQDPCDLEISGMVNRLDFEGNNLWWDYVYNSNCTHIYSIRQLSQGGYIAAGQAWSPENGTQGILLKYAPETGIESGDLSPAVEITGVSPNPFSSSLSITCNLPSPMNASLTVYDLGGRIVDLVETGFFPSGEQTVQWVPSDELSPGCYLIRLHTDAGIDVRNCVLLGK